MEPIDYYNAFSKHVPFKVLGFAVILNEYDTSFVSFSLFSDLPFQVIKTACQQFQYPKFVFQQLDRLVSVAAPPSVTPEPLINRFQARYKLKSV